MEYYVGASRMIFRETVILDFFLLGCLLGITEYTTFSLAMYELLKGNHCRFMPFITAYEP